MSPRTALPGWLPADLMDFYAHHEGVGLDASADHPIRIGRLVEAAPVVMHDLHLYDDFPLNGGWDRFTGIRIGLGCFFEELIYVTQAPVCQPGSIMAFGSDGIEGPGGIGCDDDPEMSLVLAASFGEWIARLRIDNWDEIGLVPGELDRLPAERAAQLRTRLAELNPRSWWAKG